MAFCGLEIYTYICFSAADYEASETFDSFYWISRIYDTQRRKKDEESWFSHLLRFYITFR